MKQTYREASFAYDQHVDGHRYGRDFANTIIAHFPNGVSERSAVNELRRVTEHSLISVLGNLSAPFRKPFSDGFNVGLVEVYADHGDKFSELLDSRHSNVG